MFGSVYFPLAWFPYPWFGQPAFRAGAFACGVFQTTAFQSCDDEFGRVTSLSGGPERTWEPPPPRPRKPTLFDLEIEEELERQWWEQRKKYGLIYKQPEQKQLLEEENVYRLPHVPQAIQYPPSDQTAQRVYVEALRSYERVTQLGFQADQAAAMVLAAALARAEEIEEMRAVAAAVAAMGEDD